MWHLISMHRKAFDVLNHSGQCVSEDYFEVTWKLGLPLVLKAIGQRQIQNSPLVGGLHPRWLAQFELS